MEAGIAGVRARLTGTLGAKLAAGFGVVVAVLAVALGVDLVLSESSTTQWTRSVEWTAAITAASDQIQGTRQQMAAQALYVATFDPKYKAEWEAGVASAEKASSVIEGLGDPVIAKISKEAQAADASHDRSVNALLFPAVARKDRAAALKALALADKYVRIPLEAQQQIAGRVLQLQAQSRAKAESAATTAFWVGIASIIAGLLIALVVGRGISRQITGGVRQMLKAADGIAHGDLDQNVAVHSRDEVGQMAEAFGRMIAYLRERASAAERIAGGDLKVDVQPVSDKDVLGVAFGRMVANLRDMISGLAETSSRLGASSQQMASSSEEAGRAIGEIAQAIEEVAAGSQRQVSIVQTARESSQITADAAREARQVAEQGIGAVEQASTAMEEVRASSAEAASRSAASWRRSRASPARPTCWPSTPPSRRRGRASRAAASPWSPRRCASWRRRARPQPPQSPA